MARPKGMRKIDGVWYYADGTRVSKPLQKPHNACSEVNPSEDMDDSVIVQQKPVQKVKKVARAVSLYKPEEIKEQEVKSGLVYSGYYIDETGARILVFHNPKRSQEDVEERMATFKV